MPKRSWIVVFVNVVDNPILHDLNLSGAAKFRYASFNQNEVQLLIYGQYLIIKLDIALKGKRLESALSISLITLLFHPASGKCS